MRALLRFVAICLAMTSLSCAKHEAWIEPEEAGPDFALQGEYVSLSPAVGAQVIALGHGGFRAVHLAGGLPGAGWDGETRRETNGHRDGEAVRFDDGSLLENGVIHVPVPQQDNIRLRRVDRKSPTLGASPPVGAVVVFGGDTERVDGEVDARGLLMAGATSRGKFQDARIHVEFRTPFIPTARGQARGNSGVYIQNRYEVQILDSFGLEGEWNEAGGIYQVARPRINMSFPPLTWQTYDIVFRAARFDEDGKKTQPARVSVQHNGINIHSSVDLPDKTGGGDAEGPEPGPLHLQDHGDPVFFRNVWVLAMGR
jgi:hypothetical protein